MGHRYLALTDFLGYSFLTCERQSVTHHAEDLAFKSGPRDQGSQEVAMKILLSA